jgi:hypothetical protein
MTTSTCPLTAIVRVLVLPLISNLSPLRTISQPQPQPHPARRHTARLPGRPRNRAVNLTKVD